MNTDSYTKYKTHLTIVAALIVLAHLILEHIQGGVITHYFMQDGSLPGISNWWGLLFFPILVWIVLSNIERREKLYEPNNTNILYRLLSSVLFGVIVSYLFSIDSSLLDYLMVSLFILAFFLPLYFGEYLIGFITGTLYVFGANIPLIGGVILLLILMILYKIPRMIIKFASSKT